MLHAEAGTAFNWLVAWGASQAFVRQSLLSTSIPAVNRFARSHIEFHPVIVAQTIQALAGLGCVALLLSPSDPSSGVSQPTIACRSSRFNKVLTSHRDPIGGGGGVQFPRLRYAERDKVCSGAYASVRCRHRFTCICKTTSPESSTSVDGRVHRR